ncbi:MAG: hypothetical protein ACFFAU_16640 [Candidatus Hodarchaeota archaeon]
MPRKGKGVRRILKEERRFREKRKKSAKRWLSEEVIRDEINQE